MKLFFTKFSASILLIFLLYSSVFSQDLTPEQIYEKVNDCVVVILSYDFDGKLSKQGSGVVISDKGWVVTNYHVFAECEKVEIKHNDKLISYSDIIGVDVEKDILILKIDENIFPSIIISNSDILKVGQRVYAIGSPLGMENSLSEGLISGLRNVAIENRNYIQITAGISPGSSGGAVVNSRGELIGISTSSIEGGQNLNFAIPSNDLLEIKIGSFKDRKITEANNDFYRGNIAMKNSHYEDAIEYYTRYLNVFPNNAIGYNNRGIAHYKFKEINKALNDYNKAIEINPRYSKAYCNRGIVYNDLKQFREAISDYNKAIEIDPNYATAFQYRGVTNYILKKYIKAIFDFNKAIEINPKYSTAYCNRGLVYSVLKQYNESITEYNKAIEIDPKSGTAYYNRGIAYYNLNMMYEACNDAKKAFSLGYQSALQFLQNYCK